MPWIYAQSIRAKAIHPKHSAVSDHIIRMTIENGIEVRPYTVNRGQDMRRLFNVQCSAIITDDPVKALRIRKEYEKRP